MAKFGLVLLVLAVLGVAWPEAIAVPFGILAGWVGIALLVRARRLRGRPPRSESIYESEEVGPRDG